MSDFQLQTPALPKNSKHFLCIKKMTNLLYYEIFKCKILANRFELCHSQTAKETPSKHWTEVARDDLSKIALRSFFSFEHFLQAAF